MLIVLRQQVCTKVDVRVLYYTAIDIHFQRHRAFHSTRESEEQIGSRYQPGDLVDQIDRHAFYLALFCQRIADARLRCWLLEKGL